MAAWGLHASGARAPNAQFKMQNILHSIGKGQGIKTIMVLEAKGYWQQSDCLLLLKWRELLLQKLGKATYVFLEGPVNINIHSVLMKLVSTVLT